jgi:hypothetical protein
MDEATDAALMAAGHKLQLNQAELDSLRRWKSTNYPRLEALKGLLRTAQQEAQGAREAIATLASERAANALLTAELEAAQKQRDILQAALLKAMQVLAAVDPKGCAAWLRDQ